MKKLVSFSLAFLLFLSLLALPANAQTQSLSQISPVFNQDTCVEDSVALAIKPYTTCTGDGGVSRINKLDGTGATWNVVGYKVG